MSGLWAEDDDRRAEDLVENPKRYFTAARLRAEHAVAAERPTTRSEPKPMTLGPGIVEMSLRGKSADVEALVAKMRAEGIAVWRGDSRGTEAGNGAGYRYFSVEVPPPAE